jgi:hypothetical protein
MPRLRAGKKLYLYFERVDEPLKRSELLLADEELNPVYPLLETADEP